MQVNHAQPDHRCRRRQCRPGRRPAARLRRHRRHVRRAGGRKRRCPRRRARHARDRTARPGADRVGDRCHRAVRRLRLRARCRLRRAGLAARAGPRLCGARGAGADRAGGDPVRPVERRRQGLGPLSALSRLGYAAAQAASADFALGSVGAGLGATTVNLKGGIGSASAQTPRRHHGRRAGRGQSRRQRRHRRRPDFWAAPFERDGEFGGRGWPARDHARRTSPPHQGRRRAPTPRSP